MPIIDEIQKVLNDYADELYDWGGEARWLWMMGNEDEAVEEIQNIIPHCDKKVAIYYLSNSEWY